MSRYLMNAERAVAKAQAKLVQARAELARQQALEPARQKERAEKAAAKKAAAKAAKVAAYAANPELAHNEAYQALLWYCNEYQVRYVSTMPAAFLEWKKTTEFPPNTNLYHKVARFIEETVIASAAKPIPIYAKVMTGELIPLEYHAHRSKRDLLHQLERISPKEFRIGHANIVRLEEDQTRPVQEDEIFGLFNHGLTRACYANRGSDKIVNWMFRNQYGPAIAYQFAILPAGIIYHNGERASENKRMTVYYFPKTKRAAVEYHIEPCSLDEFPFMLRVARLGGGWDGYERFTLTETAVQDILAIFETMRMEDE